MIVEAWLQRAAAERPQAVAIEADGETLTYDRLLAAASEGAQRIRQRGVNAGELVAIALPPGIDFAIALHASWLAGAGAVPIDLRLAPEERAFHATGAAALIDDALLTPEERERAVAPMGLHAEHDLSATAAVIHTSGTTSAPERVALSFGNFLWSALGSAAALGSGPDERWLSTLPVCHVGGLSILIRSAIYGSTAVVHERFQTQRALNAILNEGITIVSVVATTLSRLLDAGLQDPPKLRLALAGGGPVPDALLRTAAAAGVPVSQTYGLTESCSQASTVPLSASAASAGSASAGEGAATARARTGSVEAADRGAVDAAALGAGPPLFCTQVQIAQDGEILLAGPTIAAGSIAPDGWLHTGDLGSLDEEGNLHVVGRKSDTIVSGGENVAPAEVEAVLERHPLVLEAAVLGRPHPEWGEAVTAIVVPRDEGDRKGDRLTPHDLQSHCASMLAPFKVPKEFVLISKPLPRTRSGKLLRRELT